MLRGVKSSEAEAIVGNYDKLISRSDKKASMAAVKFFSQHKAPSFLARSLRSIGNADVKLAAVRQMRKMGTKNVGSELAALADSLESEDVYISGSEAATLHALYIEELSGLIASILGEDISTNQSLEKKVQSVLSKARAAQAKRERQSQADTDEKK